MPTIVVFAGPNGAGKTTWINQILRERDEAFTYVNPDEVARDLPQEIPNRDAAAARLVISTLSALEERQQNIMLETTLATRTLSTRLRRLRNKGYTIELIYLQLPSVEASIARAALRVAAGGHDIPEGTLRRRYPLSLQYLNIPYKPLAHSWQIWESGEEGMQVLESGPL
ncbi:MULTISPECIES: AAA family ATPase [unclassified Brevundimonas]|uniref:AAA family ATPase n=1 Tax=unclassified Brevundimonas TaxID=2622653 RepID=UPI0025C3D71C|nr:MULTISPECIES: AAA family ATPase [unclassified Brevundimonas]